MLLDYNKYLHSTKKKRVIYHLYLNHTERPPSTQREPIYKKLKKSFCLFLSEDNKKRLSIVHSLRGPFDDIVQTINDHFVSTPITNLLEAIIWRCLINVIMAKMAFFPSFPSHRI